jgi:hypothetical protein
MVHVKLNLNNINREQQLKKVLDLMNNGIYFLQVCMQN